MKKTKKISFKKIKEQLEQKHGKLEEVTAPLRIAILALEGMCASKGHQIVPRRSSIRKELKTDIWASTGALCNACGKDFGWFCPKSPDHHCHYEGVQCGTCSEHIINSKQMMEAHTRMNARGNEMHAVFWKIEYHEDRCIFCGMPEERK